MTEFEPITDYALWKRVDELQWKKARQEAPTVNLLRLRKRVTAAMVLKHGPCPKAPAKPPLWLRIGAGVAGKGDSMKKAWSWFNGKKTLLGAVLVGTPVLWEEVSKILAAGGADGAQLAAISGGLLAGLGIVHKLLKVTGLAKPE